MKLPKRLVMKNPNFSDLATSLLDKYFPESKNPYTNVKVEVTLKPNSFSKSEDKDYTQEVLISSTKNMKKEIINCACFVADMWIDDVVPKEDDLSLLDLPESVTVKIVNVDCEDDLSFQISLDYKTKATGVSK